MRRWGARLAQLVRRRRAEAEMTRELEAHLALLRADFEARGLSPREARRQAALALGGVEQARERHREARGFAGLEQWARDLRQALRSLRRAPGFTLAALLTLACGMGATAAVFCGVQTVLLAPLPYPQPQRLVALRQLAPGAAGLGSITDGLRLSPSMYFTYAEHNRAFTALGIYVGASAGVTGWGPAEQVSTVLVSDGVLPALGVAPAAGRWLLASDQDPHGAASAMLSYAYWQRRFGGNPAAIGRNLTVDGRPREIVGVMPRGFAVVDTPADLILPLAFDRAKLILAGFGYDGVGRLRPGVTAAAADADLKRMLPIWMHSWSNGPGTNPLFYLNWRITPAVIPLQRQVVGNLAPALWAVMGTMALLMLLVGANVTNLLLARAEGRQHELAIRAVLGAGRARLVRALLAESLLLAGAGALLGLGLAAAALRLLAAWVPAELALLGGIRINTPTAFFSLGLALVAGIGCGLLPALRYSRHGVAPASYRTAAGSRQRRRVRRTLVAAQVGIALVLLVGAGLVIRSVAALRAVAPGFRDPATAEVFHIAIPASVISDSARVTNTERALLGQLGEIPGVSAVGFAGSLPLENFEADWDTVYAEGHVQPATAPPLRTYQFVSPGYFGAIGTRLLAGRDLAWADVTGLRPVVLLSANLAIELWGSPQAAVGRHVREDPSQPWSEVIGVVENVQVNGLRQPAAEMVYWPPLGTNLGPAPESPLREVSFVVRSPRADTPGLNDAIQRAVAAVNANLPVASLRTMADLYRGSLALTSFTMLMLALVGGMALALGVVGVYGMLSYDMSQRRREIGIRVAVGARPGQLNRRFVGEALRLAGAGGACGLAAAAAGAPLLRSQLFGVAALDAWTFISVPALLAVAVALTAYVPVRRACGQPPMTSLSCE